ncbi:hypothetical protein M413DRAFT_444940, partial [Hebeloma cylindrosporum]
MQPSNGSAAQSSHVIGHHSPSSTGSINRCRDSTLQGNFDVTELPVEIICEIFEKFIEDDSQPKDKKNSNPPRPLISHFCRSDPTILGAN